MSDHRRNMKAGRCSVCREPVEPSKGYLFGPPWTVKCVPCSGIVVAPLRVRISLDGTEATIQPDGHLGERFQAYRAAITGARYQGGEVNRAHLDVIAAIIDRLRAADFLVDLDPAVASAVNSLVAGKQQIVRSAAAHAEFVEARLKERGLGLFPFQRTGAAWLDSRVAGLLADQMGLGKTLQTLAALPADARAVVVGPAIAKGVWRREAGAWRPDLTPCMLDGFGSFRWPQVPGEIVITNYDILRASVEPMLPQEPRAPTVETQTTAEYSVQAGDELQLLQDLPDGTFIVRKQAKKRWTTLQLHDSFYEALSAFRQALLEKCDALAIGLSGSDRVLLHSDPAKGELSVSDAACILAGIRALGDWARKRDPAPRPPQPSFTLRIEGYHEVRGWRKLAVWNHKSRLLGPESRRLTVPERTRRVRVVWQVAGCEHTFGVGHRSKSLAAPPPDGTILVLDEAHACKNPKAERTGHVRMIADAVLAHHGRCWMLTATPMLNSPPELWALLRLAHIAEEAFGSWENFARLCGGKRDTWGYRWDGEISPEVPKLLQRVSLRRMRDQVLPELPDKMWQTIPVDIDASVRDLCDEALAEMAVNGVDLRHNVSAAMLSRFKPVTFRKVSAARAALAGAKIPAMLQIVEAYEEEAEPLVVFSAHRGPIDLLGKRPGWARITGDETAEQRTAIENAFQSGQLKGVAATIQAAGLAITLTHAHHALFVDRAWTPGLNAQAEDRICRIGQDHGCLIKILVAAHPIDERVLEILAAKDEKIEAIVGASARTDDPSMDVSPGTVLDAEAIAAETKAVLDAVDKARIEAERVAAERAIEGEKLRQQHEEDEKERKARERAESNERRARERAKTRGWIEDENHPDRHAPRTAEEDWAAKALFALSGADPDHAQQRNDIGFNKGDSHLGHWLNVELPRGLTTGQWKLAVDVCRKYHRQVGNWPTPPPAKPVTEVEAPSAPEETA